MASTDWIDKNIKIIKCENINWNDVQINNITSSIKHVSKVFLSLKGSAIILREPAAGNTSDLLRWPEHLNASGSHSPYKIWPGLWGHFYGFKIV